MRRRADPQDAATLPLDRQGVRRWRLRRAVDLEIVKRTDRDGGFKVIRRRWVVERTLSWLRRNRRLMAHYEAIATVAEGFAKLAMIAVMLRRLTEPSPRHPM